MSRCQKCKTNLFFTEARDSECQWHQLGHMQVCTLLQTDNHASNPPLSFFTGRMPFLPPNQQRQSTEESTDKVKCVITNIGRVHIPLSQANNSSHAHETESVTHDHLDVRPTVTFPAKCHSPWMVHNSNSTEGRRLSLLGHHQIISLTHTHTHTHPGEPLPKR